MHCSTRRLTTRSLDNVSQIGLGTWPFSGLYCMGDYSSGWQGFSEDAAIAVVASAIEHGINHFDTADVYGNGQAERVLGKIISRNDRSRVFVATKLGYDKGGFADYYRVDAMKRNFERSLSNLQTGYVDALYLHHCDFGDNDENLKNAVDYVRDLQAQGVVGKVGLSDWNSARLARVAEVIVPEVVQVYRNAADNDYATSALQRWVRLTDTPVVFFSPFKHGFLLGKYHKPAQFPVGDFRRNVTDASDGRKIELILDICKRLQERFCALREPIISGLLSCLLQESDNEYVIAGSRNIQQLKMLLTASTDIGGENAAWVFSQFEALKTISWKPVI